MAKSKQTDLQKFEDFFGMNPHKSSEIKLEYRVRDLDACLIAAREVIRKNKLFLQAVTTGNMAQIRAFEVKEVEI